MKTRLGFVSNSSSSSFCIWGAYINGYEGKLTELITLIENSGLEWHQTPQDSVAVGRSFTSIKNDETGAQFKQSVSDKLKELGLPDTCNICEEAWYDG